MSTLARMFRPKIIDSQSAKMNELTPDLYKELLRYKSHDHNYYLQPIDFSSPRSFPSKKEAA